MGAGRKTQAINVAEKSLSPPWASNGIDTARNLGTNNLAAVIFGCKHNTIEECFAKGLFGLPSPHYVYVKNIKPGLPLFLFNYSDRKLHGVFEAVCPGRLNIDSQAWTEDGSDSTPYSAQVKFRIQSHCQPLREDQFGPIIAKNYYGPRLFWFELDKSQTNKLIALFSSSPMSRKEINHQRSLFGSNTRGKPQLECHIDDNDKKEQNVVAHATTNSGLSYSSVVKNRSSSVAHKDQSNVKKSTSEEQSDIALGPSGDSSCPTISAVGTQKTWSALFDKETVPDRIKKNDNSEIQSLEADDSYVSAWESSPYTFRENLFSEAPMREDSGNCGKEVIGDSRHEANEFGMAQDENKWQWSSSYVPLSWEEDIQPEEVHNDEDLSKKEQKYNELDCEYSLYSSMANMVLVENNPEAVAEVHSREAIVPEIQPLEFSSLVAKLSQEVQELKESQSVQSQKISWLEQELITSRLEIQQLKDGQKTLKSSDLSSGELMFIAGGFDGSSWFSSLDSYSPFEDLKRSLAPMSSLRAHASAVNLNGQLYVLGGMQGNCLCDRVESYNPTSNKWVSHPPLIQKKAHMAGVSLENNIFSIGGGNEVHHFAEVEMLDVNAERWISVGSMLEKRYAPAAAELGGAVYVVGGFNGKDILDSVERFDPRESSWMQLKSMTSRRAFHSVAVLNDKLYALGGFDGHKMLSSVEIFDPRLGSWMIEGSMSNCRGYFGSFVMRDALYVLGGLNESRKVLDSVECYKEACGWQLTNLQGIGKRCFFASAVL